MLLCEECSINSFPKTTEKKLNVLKNCSLESAALFKMESGAANCSKIKLVIYQLAFCCFFLGVMVSCLKEVFWFLCLFQILGKY